MPDDLNKSLTYSVRVSAAAMPSSCWGRYCNVAVIEHSPDKPPRQIRTTLSQRVVRFWGRCHDGSTARCARARAEREAERLAASLRRRQQSAIARLREELYQGAMASRSGEEI